MVYPNSPGFQNQHTSIEAVIDAESFAETLRGQCFRFLRIGEFTADELAKRMERSILSIRPRVTELYKMGLIIDTGKVRKNLSGKNAIVWRARNHHAAS